MYQLYIRGMEWRKEEGRREGGREGGRKGGGRKEGRKGGREEGREGGKCIDFSMVTDSNHLVWFTA